MEQVKAPTIDKGMQYDPAENDTLQYGGFLSEEEFKVRRQEQQRDRINSRNLLQRLMLTKTSEARKSKCVSTGKSLLGGGLSAENDSTVDFMATEVMPSLEDRISRFSAALFDYWS